VAEGVSYIDGFIGRDECRHILRELEATYWQPSPTYTKQPDDTFQNQVTSFRLSRTAYQEWFSEALLASLARIEAQLERRWGTAPSHLEEWQATDYPRHGKFDHHLDSGYWADHHAGERIRTFLLYLRTPIRGGGTDFRALDVYVEGKAGRLLVWENLFPNGACNHRMIHSSIPLLRGRKTTLVTWQRQKPYRKPR
jgi:prolyl 4-hydroxylase